MRRQSEGHEPERDGVLYVQGEMTDRDRRTFEAHLLACEHCWKEVQQARRGRALAERGRELSPPELREDVRAAVALSEAPPRRRVPILVPVVAAVVFGLISASVIVTAELRGRTPEQPRPIAAALASFRSKTPPSPVGTMHAAPDLRPAGLALADSGRSSLGGLPVDVFWFTDGRTKVVLFFSEHRFPEAIGATERAGTIHGWEASVGGVRLACADTPLSYLLMSGDAGLEQRAEAALHQTAQPAG